MPPTIGSPIYATSASSPLAQVVSPLVVTTTALTSSVNPSVYGQSVTFTAQVIPVTPGPVPTGTVQFSIGGAPVGTRTLSATGVATFTTNTLVAGSHTVVATYNGSAIYATSSSTLTQVVNKATTRTSLRSSDTNGQVNNQMRLTATTSVVSPGAGSPTGTVEFKLTSGTTTIILATRPIGTGGVTILNWTPTSIQVGTWVVMATYSGDANFLTSAGTVGRQRVR